MNIKPDPSTLNALSQGHVRNRAPQQKNVDDLPSNAEIVAKVKQQQQNKLMPLRKAVDDRNRITDLSSDNEIAIAKDRAIRFSKEAPMGRSSLISAAGGRNVPMGQIIDIRV